MNSRRFKGSNCIRSPPAGADCRVSNWRGAVSGLSSPLRVFQPINDHLAVLLEDAETFLPGLQRLLGPQRVLASLFCPLDDVTLALNAGFAFGYVPIGFYRAGIAGSFRLDARELYHFGPLLGFGSNVLAKIRGWATERCGTEVGKPRLHPGIGQGLVDCPVEGFDNLCRRALRRAEAAPEARLITW